MVDNVSYADILNMRNLGRKIISKQVVTNGLAMWLDGKDFKNNPPTTLWQDEAQNNPIPYTNLVTNGDFSNGVYMWSGNNISVSNNVASCTATVQYDGIEQIIPNFATYASHILYVRAFINPSVYNANVLFILNDGVSQTMVTIPLTNQYQLVSAIRTISVSTSTLYVKIQDGRTSGWTPIQSKQFEVIDLTEMFCGGVTGTGKEPSQSWCDVNLPFVVNTGCANIPLSNKIIYNPNTWAEWTLVQATGNSTGLTFTVPSAGNSSAIIPTNMKPNTNYGILLNVVSSTLATAYFGNSASSAFTGGFTFSGYDNIGSNKFIVTTGATITINQLYLYIPYQSGLVGNAITINNFQIFELPPNSQIATDFASSTASQLMAKYTMPNNAIPSGMTYLAPYTPVMSDFLNKVMGSLTTNPNILQHNEGNATTGLLSPSSFGEVVQSYYNVIMTLDGATSNINTSFQGVQPQQLFQFNVVAIFQKKYGAIPITYTGIPATDLANQIAWLKANVYYLNCIWYGFGSGPNGNMAYLRQWVSGSWVTGNVTNSNTSTTSTMLQAESLYTNYFNIISMMDSNGYVSYLAYADPASASSPTMLVMTGHGLLAWDLVQNVTRGLSSNVTAVISANSINTGSLTGQTIGDTINKYHSIGTKVSITGTTTTNVTITSHGLSTGDMAYNSTHGDGFNVVTVVDVNNFTVPVDASQVVGDSFVLYHYYGQQTAEGTTTTQLTMTGNGLIMNDLIRNVTRGNGMLQPSIITSVNNVVLNGSMGGQIAGDTINKYHNGTSMTALAGTTTTNVCVNNHGMSVGDTATNQTRAYNIQIVTAIIDLNNFTIANAITGQTTGDMINPFRYYGTQLAEAGIISSIINTDYVNLNIDMNPASGFDNVSGVVFDGIVDTLNCGNGSVLNWTIGTLEMKFVPLTFNANYARLFSKEATTGCDSYALAIDPSLHKFYFFTNGGVSACTSNYDCALNTPVHVVFTCDGTNYRIYVNGALDSTTAIGANVITITANNLLIGNNPPNTRQANIDCKFARVYNRVLTASEITRNYNA